jgi:hypothetical protein
VVNDAALESCQRKLLVHFLEMFGDSRDSVWSSYSLGEVVDQFSGELRLNAIAWSADYHAAQRQPLLAFKRLE